MNRFVAQTVADIAANTYAGAGEIADQGADMLLRYARTGDAESRDIFQREVIHIGGELIRAQPSMAPLINLVNDVLWRIETCDTLRAMRLTVANVARDFKRRLCIHETAISEAVLQLIHEDDCVLTNSRSSTVRAALWHAHRTGRHFRVICAEGRPGMEGRTLAAELAEVGIPVTLVVDALALSSIDQAQLVLIGADHLTSSGVMNKVGSYPLAMMAQSQQVPVYTLCSSEKFLPPGYPHFDQVSRSSDQVWDTRPAGVHIENYYFDHTPLSALSGVVTEHGILPPPAIEGWMAALRLHPALLHDSPVPVLQ